MLYKEIIRTDDLIDGGKTRLREAVRGVIIKDTSLLMIYSLKEGDYKFPGGGVEENETREAALMREIGEECGASVVSINSEIGKIIEFDRSLEEKYDVFKMISTYYLCEVNENLRNQSLDQYEEDLGFTPVWISIDEAISTNQKLIDSHLFPSWTPRELHALKYIKQTFQL